MFDRGRVAGLAPGPPFLRAEALGSPARKWPEIFLNASDVFEPGTPSTLTKIPGKRFRASWSFVQGYAFMYCRAWNR